MKQQRVWFELFLVVGGLSVAMVAAMWIQRPGSNCAMSSEAQRVLVLGREVDREHLAADLVSAAREADRYKRLATDVSQQQARYVSCEATLVQEIATRHGLAADQLQPPSAIIP